ncbi:MAG: hypothetical protein J5919_03640 [Clostridia bacterium]|nr:hypothetical protein [Clostridia bacterium]
MTLNFWDSEAWGLINLTGVLLVSLLLANLIKKSVGFLRRSLIPTSVLGGLMLLIVAVLYEKLGDGSSIFDTAFFGGGGTAELEVLTYHCLALGFIAVTFKPSGRALTRKRSSEVFNTGVTTVSGYLIQGILGMAITLVAANFITGLLPAAGVLLPFGYGQGTGQALNWGSVYENDYGFTGGRSFGLTVAALGFLSASIGGVIHLNILRHRRKIKAADEEDENKALLYQEVASADEIPVGGSMDKLTVQIALVAGVYVICGVLMKLLGGLAEGLKSTIYGFNFLFGVLMATLIKFLNNLLRKKGVIKKQYISGFLMARISGFFFDLMIVAGIAAIKISVLKDYWPVIIVMGLVGAFATYFYIRFICRKMFPEYSEEQFLVMYGMLTGTASTGMILLREIDPAFDTPAAENLVYQNLPAIVFGFPMMLLASLAPKSPMLTFFILIGFFAVMNGILLASYFIGKKHAEKNAEEKAEE